MEAAEWTAISKRKEKGLSRSRGDDQLGQNDTMLVCYKIVSSRINIAQKCSGALVRIVEGKKIHREGKKGKKM